MTPPKQTISDDERAFASMAMQYETDFFEEKPKVQDESFLQKVRNKIPKGLKDAGNKLLSLDRAASKGLIEGTRNLGKALGPLQPDNREEFEAQERFMPAVEEAFPSEEGFGEAALRRGGKIAPFMLTGGGNPTESLMRSLFGGVAGEGAKELGFGETVQTLAETGPLITPKSLFSMQGAIEATPEQEQLVNLLRRAGATEERIAPILQNPESLFTRARTKLAPRSGRIESRLEASRNALSESVGSLRNHPEAGVPLSPQGRIQFRNQTMDILADLPADVRDVITRDLNDLLGSQSTASDLINFYRDINYTHGGPAGGRLGLLKEPVEQALQEISPPLAEDFNLLNDAYSRFSGVRKQLKPTQVSNMVEALRTFSKPIQVMSGIFMGMPGVILEIAGEEGLRQLAVESLTNPRFVNLGKKFASAIKNSSTKLLESVTKQFANLIEDENPSLAQEIRETDEKEFLEQLKLLEEGGGEDE